MRIKDIFSPYRWKAVIIFLIKKLLRILGETEIYLEQHEIEQYMYRMLRCPECVVNGKCLHCGCDTIGRMNNKTDTCSKLNWGIIQTKEEWEYSKKLLGIKFGLERNRDITWTDFKTIKKY